METVAHRLLSATDHILDVLDIEAGLIEQCQHGEGTARLGGEVLEQVRRLQIRISAPACSQVPSTYAVELVAGTERERGLFAHQFLECGLVSCLDSGLAETAE